MGLMYRRLDRLILSSLLVVITAAGCGPRVKVPTAPVVGTITVNGKPVEGLEVVFVPEAKIRPGVAVTDTQGRYEAKFLNHQAGVPLGPCTVTISRYSDLSRASNLIPREYNEKAAENPALRLTIPKEGTAFNFDVKTDKPLP